MSESGSVQPNPSDELVYAYIAGYDAASGHLEEEGWEIDPEALEWTRAGVAAVVAHLSAPTPDRDQLLSRLADEAYRASFSEHMGTVSRDREVMWAEEDAHERGLWLDSARAAIAAYEAEQTACLDCNGSGIENSYDGRSLGTCTTCRGDGAEQTTPDLDEMARWLCDRYCAGSGWIEATEGTREYFRNDAAVLRAHLGKGETR